MLVAMNFTATPSSSSPGTADDGVANPIEHIPNTTVIRRAMITNPLFADSPYSWVPLQCPSVPIATESITKFEQWLAKHGVVAPKERTD